MILNLVFLFINDLSALKCYFNFLKRVIVKTCYQDYFISSTSVDFSLKTISVKYVVYNCCAANVC